MEALVSIFPTPSTLMHHQLYLFATDIQRQVLNIIQQHEINTFCTPEGKELLGPAQNSVSPLPANPIDCGAPVPTAALEYPPSRIPTNAWFSDSARGSLGFARALHDHHTTDAHAGVDSISWPSVTNKRGGGFGSGMQRRNSSASYVSATNRTDDTAAPLDSGRVVEMVCAFEEGPARVEVLPCSHKTN